MLQPNDFLCNLLFDQDRERMQEFFQQELRSNNGVTFQPSYEPVLPEKIQRAKNLAQALSYLHCLEEELRIQGLSPEEIRRILEDIRRDILVQFRRE